MKRKMYGLMVAIGVIIGIGTVGSIDIGTISMTQGILQTIGAFVTGLIGYIGLAKEGKKW